MSGQSHIEPGRNPNVLDVPQQPQRHFQGQRDHAEQKELGDRKLQQAHALEVLSHIPPEQRVDEKASKQVIAAHYNCTKNNLREVRSYAENVRQIAIYFIDQPVMVPGLPGPEPLPAGPPYEGSD